MATIDKTGSGALLGVTPLTGLGKTYVIKKVLDLTGGAVTGGDVYQMLAIPAQTKVVEVGTLILVPAVGTTLTMNVGDGGATNGWDASVDGKAVAGTNSIAANGTDARAVATSNGYLYEAADSIDIVMTTATGITAGPKLLIFATCIDYS